MNEVIKLVLHVGQRMMDVADMQDIEDFLYWDEHERTWRRTGPSEYVAQRTAECLTRMKVEPQTTTEDQP